MTNGVHPTQAFRLAGSPPEIRLREKFQLPDRCDYRFGTKWREELTCRMLVSGKGILGVEY